MSSLSTRLDSIFYAAVEIASSEERAGYVARACGDDLALRQEVERLLAAHFQAGAFLEHPLVDLPPTSGFTPESGVPAGEAEAAGTIIGPYKLVEPIGEGGMGTVWMAQQTQPVKRLVALKLIKPGMDSRQVIARFEQERQVLALMDHPNIARVLDAGMTEKGRPYFVMELVKGVPVTRYCDEARLTPRQRVELFVPVCQAIQHAHQKGVIHRDLKPSNVLVAQYDGRPVPKVIDFGVAKAVGQPLTEKTLVTGFGAVVGTLEYMSPEQAELNQLDVDTRSDVYSLGVLLYELMTGSTPLDRRRLREEPLLEVLRLIREEEPPTPSHRLSSTDELPAVAASRSLEPRRLRGEVQGELDWIVMKCLEKDRNRRYETAIGLARDVERYLADEPVVAGPPSAGYRLRKFARRNRRGLATAALAGVLLLAAVGAVAGSLGWAARGRETRRRETERGVLEAVAQAGTYVAQGERQMDHPARWQLTVGMADGAAQHAEALLAAGEGTPDLAARVREARAAVDEARRDSTVLFELDRIQLEKYAIKEGHLDGARVLPRYAAVLGTYGVGPSNPGAEERLRASRVRELLLTALEDWRDTSKDEGEKQRLEEILRQVEPEADAFLGSWRAAVRRGDRAVLVRLAGSPKVLDLPATAVVKLARDLWKVREVATTERLLRANQARYPGDFWLNLMLGLVLLEQRPSRAEEAIRYMTAALALRDDSPLVYLSLGSALYSCKELDGAIAANQAALKLDPLIAEAHNNIGVVLVDKKDVDGAILEFREALRVRPDYVLPHNGLGTALGERGDLDGAIREFEAVIRLTPGSGEAHYNLGRVLELKKDLDGAVRAYQAALKIDPGNAEAHCNLATTLRNQGRYTEALPAARRGHELGSRRPGWPYPSAEWVHQLELLITLDDRLAKALRGERAPAGAAEYVNFARICQLPTREMYAAAAGFYRDGFSAMPGLLDDTAFGHRYNAACAAALAGCGKGKDAQKLTEAERGRLRQEALRWLREDLAAWDVLLCDEPAKFRPVVLQQVRHWQQDSDLDGVRAEEAVARLPEAERAAWRKLWQEVEKLGKEAAGSP